MNLIFIHDLCTGIKLAVLSQWKLFDWNALFGFPSKWIFESCEPIEACSTQQLLPKKNWPILIDLYG